MKIYLMIPIAVLNATKIKERDHTVFRSILDIDYSKHFGEKNEYYCDLAYKMWELSKWRNIHYDGCKDCYYDALDPHGMIKKRIIK